jgi:hypothetical protein
MPWVVKFRRLSHATHFLERASHLRFIVEPTLEVTAFITFTLAGYRNRLFSSHWHSMPVFELSANDPIIFAVSRGSDNDLTMKRAAGLASSAWLREVFKDQELFISITLY